MACIFDFLLEKIKDFKLYYYGLNIIPYTRYNLVSSWEKMLYTITYIGQKVPYLIYRPNLFIMQELSEEQEKAINIPEKILIFFERVFSFLRFFIGIRIAYVIMILVWLWKKFQTQIMKLQKLISEIDYLHKIQNAYQYITDNGSAILLVIIVLLSLYIFYIKKKSASYEFEDIWAKEESEKIKDIADKQIEISNILLEIRPIVYENCEECRSCIRQIDYQIKWPSPNNYSLWYNFQEYDAKVNEIKDKIKFIEENNGKRLFRKYNKDMWFQLFMLRLTNSDNKYQWDGIGSCSKNEIEHCLNDLSFERIKKTRNSMLSCWTGCISTINGIERYLFYISKRRKRHSKLRSSLNNVKSIKEIANDIKE